MPTHKGEPDCSMSVFNGLLAIRQFQTKHPAVSLEEVIVALKRVAPDEAYHDYERALILDQFVPAGSDHSDATTFFRQVLGIVILQRSPWWLRLAAFGRERLVMALSPNEVQCFDAAGLLSDSPDPQVLSWWDTIAQTVRADQEAKRTLQGRKAELLSVAYETERLAGLGITDVPRWIAFEDSSAGYDVHSFDQGPVGPVAKLIEVKSTIRRPPEIFITKNEWDTAVEREPHYWFHVWLLPEETLIELTPSDLAGHIPENQGTGVWEIARIILPIEVQERITT